MLIFADVYEEYKKASKRYRDTIDYTKKQHWRNWLKRVEDPDIWTVCKLISSAASDSGKARIPTLKVKTGDQKTSAYTNNEKNTVLTKGFFPPKP